MEFVLVKGRHEVVDPLLYHWLVPRNLVFTHDVECDGCAECRTFRGTYIGFEGVAESTVSILEFVQFVQNLGDI